MARQLRIDYPGAWHHVMNRGRRKELIFFSDSDRLSFLELLARICERYGIRINAYCLMGNHYHLLIQAPEGRLSEAMRYLDSVYTLRFNRRHDLDGPLFRGRFRSKLVDSDGYLECVVRYVHRNPIDLPGIKTLEDYRWSSYPAFLAGPSYWPSWLFPDAVWSTGRLASSELRRRTEDLSYGQGFDFDANPEAVGSENFIQAALSKSLFDDQTIGHLRAATARPKIDEIEMAVAEELGEPEISAPTLSKFDLKLIAIGLAQDLGGLPLSAVADHFGYSSAQSAGNASHRFRKRLDNSEYALAVERVRKALEGVVVDRRC